MERKAKIPKESIETPCQVVFCNRFFENLYSVLSVSESGTPTCLFVLSKPLEPLSFSFVTREIGIKILMLTACGIILRLT